MVINTVTKRLVLSPEQATETSRDR